MLTTIAVVWMTSIVALSMLLSLVDGFGAFEFKSPKTLLIKLFWQSPALTKLGTRAVQFFPQMAYTSLGHSFVHVLVLPYAYHHASSEQQKASIEKLYRKLV